MRWETWTLAAAALLTVPAISSAAPPVPGARIWLTAEQGVVNDGAGNVERWEDQSGNGNHFEQAIEAKRPQLIAQGFVRNAGDLVLLPRNTNGNATWGGTLGLDFVVEEEIRVTRLAAFDHQRDGIEGTITVQVRSRDDGGTIETAEDDLEGAILEQMTFTATDPGTLEDSYRWKTLAQPLILQPGSYTISAWGYTGSDWYFSSPNAARGPTAPGVRWVGKSRFANTNQPEGWPQNLGTVAGRYGGAMNLSFESTARSKVALPALRFDGADDGLQVGAGFDLGRPSTVLIAFRPDNSTFGYAIQNGAGNHWYISNDRYNSQGTLRQLNPDWAKPRVAAMISTATETRAFDDLDDVTHVENLTAATPGRLALGGGSGRSNSPLAGRIAEVLVYDRQLTPDEMRRTQAYLGAKYGIFETPVAAPEIAPVGDIGTGPVSITLSTITAGAEIRYTTDGTEPLVSSTLYSGAFSVARGIQVKARAFLAGSADSGISSQFYGDQADADLPVGGLVSWLRADRGLDTDSSGNVIRWRDLTGNGNDMVQGTSGQRPLAASAFPQGGGIAIKTLGGNVGTDTYTGTLGADFEVTESIEISELAAFDHLSDGFGSPVTVQLWTRDDRSTAATPEDDMPGSLLAEMEFSSASPGTLDGAFRLKPLATPLTLAPGNYTILAWGFHGANAYRNSSDASWVGDGLRFVNRSRYGATAGSWATILDSHPVKYNGAGNFRFRKSGVTPTVRPAVIFDGVDDGLWALPSSSIGRPSTVFIGYEQLSAGIILQNTASGWWFIRNDGNYADGWVSNRTIPFHEPLTAAVGNRIGGTRFFLNGEDLATNPNLATPIPGRLALGGGNGFSINPAAGRVAEVIVFDRELTASERFQVEDYLARRYQNRSVTVPEVVIAPEPNYGEGSVTVSFSSGVPDAQIRYTSDGSEPHGASMLYTAPFSVPRGTQVKARAFVAGGNPGLVATAFYGQAGATGDLPVSGAAMWLRGDQGLELDETGSLRRWRDLTGNERDMVQGIPEMRPRPSSSGLRSTSRQAILVDDTEGNGVWGGNLGEDFIVDEALEITSLGAFDHRGDGFAGTITVQLWSRNDGGTSVTQSDDTAGTMLAERVFTPAAAGDLSGNLRFKALAAPITLAPGAYTIFAFGYTGNDRYYEGARSVDGSDGRFRFVGNSRFSNSPGPANWPSSFSNRTLKYGGAANFLFTPRPGSADPKPVVVFDGNHDGLRAVESVNFSRPSTILVAFEFDRAEQGYVIQNDAGTHWNIRQNGFYANAEVRNLSFASSRAYVAGMVSDIGATRAFLNGEDVTFDSTVIAATPGRLNLGGGTGRVFDPAPVRIAEVVVFDRVLNAVELELMQGYLGARHGIFPLRTRIPEISPAPGFGSGPVAVTISTTTPGAEIRYTLDGSTPDETSILYTGSFNVPRGTRVRAISLLPGYETGGIAEAFYGSTDAHPLPVPDPAFWVNSSSGLELAPDGSVRRWRDLSGHGRDLVQPIPSKAPQLRSMVFNGPEQAALTIPPGTTGGRTYAGWLGTDFLVDSEVEITQLGVFDSASDGIAGSIQVRLHQLNDNGTPSVLNDDTSAGVLASLTFTAAAPGTLDGGMRYLPLATPQTLAPGRYLIEARGYTGVDTYDSADRFDENIGNGISWLSVSRFSASAGSVSIPGTIVGDNRYLASAGFKFRRAGASGQAADAVRFDGVDDGMLGPLDFLVGRPSTVLMVYRQLGGTHGRLLQSGSAANWLLGPHSGTQGYFAEGWVTQQALRGDFPSLSVAVQSADSSRYLYNGEELTTNALFLGNLGRIAVGGGEGVYYQPTNADLVELVIYDRVLDEGDLQRVSAALANRYNLSQVQLSPPVASPAGGLFSSGQTVSLSHSVPGVEIRYTLDGSEPDVLSQLYSFPFVVATDTTVKAKGFLSGYLASNASDHAFFIDSAAPAVPSRNAMQLWLRAGVGTELDSSSLVGRWRDLSGKGADAVQDVAASRPTLNSTLIGSAPSVVFDGSNDHFSLPGGFSNFTGGLTAMFVFRADQVGTGQRFLDFGRGASHEIYFGRFTTTTSFDYAIRPSGLSVLRAPEAILPLSNTILTVSQLPGGGTKIFRNGSLVAETASLPLPSNLFRNTNYIGRANVGGTAHYSGGISEIVLYNTALGDLEREQLEQSISSRYGIASTSVGTVAFAPDASQLYPSGVNVTLQTVTPDAEIRFTLDGTVPDESSALYNSPIPLTASTRVRARAFAQGFNASQFSEATYLIGQPPSSGDGLLATYYDNADLTGPSLTRVDRKIDFQFGSGSPDPAIAPDTWSARWTGKLVPRFTEAYTLYTLQDDGMRVWIDLNRDDVFDDATELLINEFTIGGLRERVSSPITLQAGLLYNVKVEFFENTGSATARLLWSSFSEPKAAIPQSQLFSDAQFSQTVSTPVIAPGQGIYTAAIEVSIATSTESPTIYYTTDGSEPTTNSTPYAVPFTVAATSTVRARAYKAGFNPSGVASVTYTIDSQPPTITSFAWNAVPIANGETFIRKGTLSTTATDNQGVTRGEFFYEPAAGSSRILIGSDNTPGNGLSATWDIASVSDGPYRVITRVFDTSGTFSESVRTVNVALAVPAVPQIVLPASGVTVQDPVVALRVEAEPNVNLRLFRDGVFIFSGYANNSGILNYTASIPTGASSLKAVARNRAGSSADSNAVTVNRVREFPQLGLSFDANTVVEGSSVTGTITIPAAAATDLLIQVTTNRPDRMDAVLPVLLPAGQTAVTFPLRARLDSIIQLLSTIIVTAQTPEYRNTTAELFLADSPYPVVGIVLDESSVLESAGQVTGRVTLENPRNFPLRVHLTNTLPTKVQVPQFVTIPNGQTTVMFSAIIFDNLISDGNQTVQIGAEVRVGDTPVASGGPVPLEVRDDDGPSLAFSAPRPLLNQGASMNLTLTRSGGNPAASLAVTLSQTPAGRVNFPASATFPPNVNQIIVPVSAPTSSGSGTHPVVVRGAASGFTDALLDFNVSDEAKPDLVPRALVAPVQVQTESTVSVDYRVENYGPVPTSAPFFERVFLSKDTSLSGDDVLVRQVEQVGTVAAGGGYGRSVSIVAPRDVGDYYLIVTVDPGDAINEISETNNTVVLLTPMEVRAAYAAVVSTETSVIATNNPITLTGTATRINGLPAAFVTVSIHISMGGTKRVISALTNSAGNFTTTFRPLPNEGGVYIIGAAHPGLQSAAEQDQFEILTMGFDPPTQVRISEGETVVANAVVRNPNGRDLTGLQITVGELPAGLTVTPNVSATTIAANNQLTVPLTISAASGFSGIGRFGLTATTAEGVTMSTGLDIRAELLRPVLTLDPSSLTASALRGESRSVSMLITNTGGLETGEIQVLLPDLPWVKVASANPIASILPGGSAGVSIQLCPDATVPLTLYSGNLVLSSANGGTKSVPFNFRVVTDLTGDLEVEVVNELFYFTDEAPKLAGAVVTIRDAVTSEQVAVAMTTETGTVSFPSLMEGWYRIGVTADKHDSYSNNFYVAAGQLNPLRVFISKQLVTYTWAVKEVEIQDTYRITIETTFETNVPAPVVTVSPASIDVADLTELGQSKVVNMTLTNQGFIAAQQSEFDFSEHPFYTFTPLVKNVGTIPAKSSLVVPVTIQRIGIFDENGDIVLLQQPRSDKGKKGPLVRMPRAGSRVPCGAGGKVTYRFPCGPEIVVKSAPIGMSGINGNCRGGGGPGGGGYSGFHGGYFSRGGSSGPGGSRGASSSGISFTSDSNCDPCYAKALAECVIGFFPWGCAYAGAKCAASAAVALFSSSAGSVRDDCLNAAASCAAAALKAVPLVGQVVSAIQCVDGMLGCGGGGGLGGAAGAAAGGGFGSGPLGPPPIRARDGSPDPLYFNLGEPWLELMSPEARETVSHVSGSFSRAEAVLDFYGVLYGTRHRVLIASQPAALPWVQAYDDAKRSTSDAGDFISPAEMAALAGLSNAFEPAERVELMAIAERSNRSIEYGLLDIFEPEDVPAGQSLDFISDTRIKQAANVLVAAYDKSRELGFNDPLEEFAKTSQDIKEALISGGGGVCSRVKIQISQDLVLTRTAFEATLTLENERDDEAVSAIGFDLQVRDLTGEPAEDLFNIRITQLDNLAAIDGTGELPVSSAGTVQWTLIPRDTAALTEERQYTVGGVIRFVQDGNTFNIPVENVPITVRPDASLSLKYFHQRDVFSDDPFTDIVEPAIPYKLAVMVENNGFGTAKDLKIISGQPQIVENEKGLFIDFKIIGTEVDGEPLSPSLTAEFGELLPGQRKIATFLMTSTLQGLFIDYSATFEHVSGLGDERISLLKNVEIHEMIRTVMAQGPGADSSPDFLVNDIPDINDYPDTVHYSDGGSDLVTVRETGTFTGALSPGNLSITLDVGAFGGWSYIRLPDPGAGNYRLASAVRSDGRVLPLDFNVWQTDRTFIGQGRRPRYEHIIHLADTDSAGVYTLTYEPVAPLDSTPPTSSITAMPAESSADVPVFWTGTDNEAVVFYDIYVSTNGGPFTLWKGKIRETAAIYPGTPGESYSFYSLAYDNAGNKESKPAVAEATTLATNNNLPPVFTPIPAQTIEEGEIFSLTARATDPDGNPGDIRYSIGSTQTGIVINPVTGLITWTTGETDGGKVVSVVVVATDGGVPPAVANQLFTLTVLDINDPPYIQPVAAQTVSPGGVLIVDVDAVDRDFPLQVLTYSLEGAPDGASIDPATGVIQWSPTTAQADKVFPFNVRVTDSGTPAESSLMSFSVNVAPNFAIDLPPSFTHVPVVLWVKGKSYSLTIEASDPEGDSITLAATLTNTPGASFNDGGNGVGVLNWNPSATSSGTYEVPVTATANGKSTSASVRIRVEDDNLYWSWAAEAFGELPDGFDLSLLDLNADPDGDNRGNVHEMALLTNPMRKDSVPVAFTSEFNGAFATMRLRIHRRTGSGAFVDLKPQRSDTLINAWQFVPTTDYTTVIDSEGDSDGRPETQSVDFEILEFYPTGAPSRRFYRIESSPK